MTDEPVTPEPATHRDGSRRPPPLDYECQPSFGTPERLGLKDAAVIIFILLGPILLWAVTRAIGIC